MDSIKYRKGYRYQLEADYTLLTDILPPGGVATGNDYVWLGGTGMLIIRRGYAWDGPSGPTIDTPDSLRGSLVHDALYQLMREGFLSQDYRERADKLFLAILLVDQMPPLRAGAWFAGVRAGASYAANPKSARPVLIAP